MNVESALIDELKRMTLEIERLKGVVRDQAAALVRSDHALEERPPLPTHQMAVPKDGYWHAEVISIELDLAVTLSSGMHERVVRDQLTRQLAAALLEAGPRIIKVDRGVGMKADRHHLMALCRSSY